MLHSKDENKQGAKNSYEAYLKLRQKRRGADQSEPKKRGAEALKQRASLCAACEHHEGFPEAWLTQCQRSTRACQCVNLTIGQCPAHPPRW